MIGTAPISLANGQLIAWNCAAARELRRPAALRPDCVADERGEPVGHHVDRGAGHDLVGALVDRGVAVNEREDDGRRDAGQKPEPYVSGKGRSRGGSERADQNFALEPDVDDARALRPQARKAGENERDGEPHAGGENDNEGVEPFHARPPVRWAVASCAARAASRPGGGTCARALRRTAPPGPG